MENPLPISPGLENNLNKLSQLTARVLSTPDLYDVENLARPGVCGDYAVILKKYFEKEIKSALPTFVTEVDLSGKGGPKERVEVVFMNPRKLMNDKAREEVCKSLTNAMLRTIATIVACLASIQVAVPARKTAVAGIGVQVGGAAIDVRDWLVARQYISAADVAKPVGSPMKMGAPLDPTSLAKMTKENIHYHLTLGTNTGNMTPGTIAATGGTTAAMPTGALRIQFLDPITITGTSGTNSVLPIRIVDSSNMPWIAGILYNNIFRSFNTSSTVEADLYLVLEALFRKTQGWSVSLPDNTRAEIQVANSIFSIMQRTRTPDVMRNALAPFFQKIGAWPGGVGAPPLAPAPYGAPPYGGIPPPGYGGYGGFPPPPGGGYAPVPGAAAAVPYTGVLRAPVPGAQQLQYTIPQSATKNLLETLKAFRTQLAIENSPAAMRAQALAGVSTPSRDVRTSICQDPYWTLPNLSRVYPWATLQFLCVKDWSTLSGDRSKVVFEAEWLKFISDLDSLYSAAGNNPTLEHTAKTAFLDQMKFKDINKLTKCASGPTPIVRFKEVNDGLLEIQGLYERHVAATWRLLNKLIFTIVDPSTKTEIVRLHPDVLKAPTAEKYVEDCATEARKLISDFYTNIERAYLKASANLQVVP